MWTELQKLAERAVVALEKSAEADAEIVLWSKRRESQMFHCSVCNGGAWVGTQAEHDAFVKEREYIRTHDVGQ